MNLFIRTFASAIALAFYRAFWAIVLTLTTIVGTMCGVVQGLYELTDGPTYLRILQFFCLTFLVPFDFFRYKLLQSLARLTGLELVYTLATVIVAYSGAFYFRLFIGDFPNIMYFHSFGFGLYEGMVIRPSMVFFRTAYHQWISADPVSTWPHYMIFSTIILTAVFNYFQWEYVIVKSILSQIFVPRQNQGQQPRAVH